MLKYFDIDKKEYPVLNGNFYLFFDVSLGATGGKPHSSSTRLYYQINCNITASYMVSEELKSRLKIFSLKKNVILALDNTLSDYVFN